MKKILLFALTLSCLILSAADADAIRQALYSAVDQGGTALQTAPFGKKTITVLPIRGDIDGIVSGRLKNLLTKIGFVCVEGSNDPMWNTVLKEIAWNERKSDILDTETIAKLGKLKASQILLYGSIRNIDENPNRVYAEIELHATELATKQHIWGGNFAARFYLAKDVYGIISLDNGLKTVLKKNFEIARKSMESPTFAHKLSSIKTVTVIPLTGDIDQYMTGLAIEALTQTKHSPKNPQIPSLSHIRSIARDGLVETDGVFYGSVRDLQMGKPITKRVGKKMITETSVDADIQLFIEDVKTGVVLWSKTITLSEQITSERELSGDEISIKDSVHDDLKDNWKSYIKIAGVAIGVILLLLLAIFGIKAFLSYNSVR